MELQFPQVMNFCNKDSLDLKFLLNTYKVSSLPRLKCTLNETYDSIKFL